MASPVCPIVAIHINALPRWNPSASAISIFSSRRRRGFGGKIGEPAVTDAELGCEMSLNDAPIFREQIFVPAFPDRLHFVLHET